MRSNTGFWLDFKNKVAFYGKKDPIGNCVPATEKERKAFIAHFYNKGVKRCTFQQLKQFVNFHGVRIDGRIYATIQVTDKFLYIDLLEKSEDFQEAIRILRHEAFAKTNESEIKKMIKVVSKKMLKTMLSEMEKQVEEVFNF